jgi:hypothetical protein
MKTRFELTEAYHNATSNYEPARTGIGDRLDAFTKMLYAERVLTGRVANGYYQHLKYYREHYAL